MQFSRSRESPFLVYKFKNFITAASTVGKYQNLSIMPFPVKVVEESRQFAFIVLEMNQPGVNPAFNLINQLDCIGLEVKEADNGSRIGNSCRQGDFLNLLAGSAAETMQQIDQLPAPVLMDKGMNFINDYGMDPEKKPP